MNAQRLLELAARIQRPLVLLVAALLGVDAATDEVALPALVVQGLLVLLGVLVPRPSEYVERVRKALVSVEPGTPREVVDPEADRTTRPLDLDPPSPPA